MTYSQSYKKSIRKFAHQDAMTSIEYKRLNQRKYYKPNGFIEYPQVCREIACQLHTIPIAHQLGKFQDITYYGVTYSFWKAYTDNKFGVYAIAPDLMADFKKTDPPKHLYSLRRLFDRALFMLPKGSIITPDGDSMDWILVEMLEPYFEDAESDNWGNFLTDKIGRTQTIINTPYPNKDKYRVKWCCSIGYENVYQSVTGLPSPEDDKPMESADLFYAGNPKIEKQFVKYVSGLVFQMLLYLCIPNATQELVQGFGGSRQKRKGANAAKLPKNYIMVGHDYKPLRVTHKGGTHASPEEHDRRGHWRTLPWRDIKDREVWVRPTTVNKSC